MRRLLSLILSILMISGVLFTAPITSNALESNVYASGANYSGTTGSCTWNLDTTTGVLKISGTGAMGDYSSSSVAPWYNHRSYIKTVNIAKGVTSIGDSAFFGCTSLTSVTIPSSVTSIGIYAFYYCTSLTSVTIPSSVISIDNHVFEYCTSLTSVTIPSSVTSIDISAFRYCTSLTSIDVNSNNTKYSSINGNLYNKDQTTLIQYAIGKTATSFTIPSSVTSIGDGAFHNCKSLTSVTIPSSVTSIGYDAFYYCTSLTSVTIPSSVTSIGSSAFEYCTNLTSVTIPSSVTSIGSWAFYYCTSLTSVTIPSSVTSIGSYAFEYCTSLTSIDVNSNNTKYSSVDGNLYNKNKTTLIQYAIGKTATSFTIPSSVKSIGSSAFYNCESLTSITIPSSVTSIGNYAFYNCSSLKTVYYTGTESDWSNISIGSNNTPLTSATIYYSVEETEATAPTTESIEPTTESAPAYDYYMIGSKALFGADWKIDPKNGMVKLNDRNYYLAIENAPAGNFYFKVMDKNNVLYPEDTNGIVTTTGGETVIFCFNPKKGYAVVSTDGTLPTYPTETESTEPTETTQPTTVTTAPTTEATEPTTASTAPTTEKTQPTTEPTESTAFVCNHSNIRTVGAKSATYFEKGYTGDKVCEYCGEVVAEGRNVAKKVLATPKTTIKLKGGNSIVISYTKVKDAQGFEINCKLGSRTYIKRIKTTRSKTIWLTNIKRGTKVTVQVRAYTTSGKKTAYSNFTKAKTFKTEELSKISYSSIKSQRLNSTTLKVTWSKVAKADGYQIKISASYKGENHTVDKKIKNNYITLTNINKDQKLSIKIRPYKVVGGKTTYGSWVSKKIQ